MIIDLAIFLRKQAHFVNHKLIYVVPIAHLANIPDSPVMKAEQFSQAYIYFSITYDIYSS